MFQCLVCGDLEQKCWQDHNLGCAGEDGEGISHRLLDGWMWVRSGKVNMQSIQCKVTKNRTETE